MSDQDTRAQRASKVWRNTMIPVSDRKKGTKHQPAPGKSPQDGLYSLMARFANPSPQPWMSDASKLPKKPPGRHDETSKISVSSLTEDSTEHNMDADE